MKKEGIKGYLFEALVKKLINKAGFRDDFESKQLTTKRKKFHGRGAVHQIDVFGEFYFSIPFIYPINILGEVKGYKGQISLSAARNFCGVVKDIIEWYKIDTKTGGTERFSTIGQKRHTHCPVIFSLNGFSKSALEYMYAQGIYPITYENNSEILRIFKKFSGFLNQIDYKKLPKKYTIFKNFEEVQKIPEESKKQDFKKKYDELMKLIDAINPYFAMLGGKYVVNILFNKKDSIASIQKNDNYQIEYNKSFIVKLKKRKIAEFSFSKQFLKYYLIDEKRIKETFAYIDIFVVDKKSGSIHRMNFSAESIQELTKKLGDRNGNK